MTTSLLNEKHVKLILEDGSVFKGISFGYEKSISGEIVFNTAMTGYPESLTDPSYKGQILVSTYPLIGNYGVPQTSSNRELLEFYESDTIQISALIISDYSFDYNHWNAKQSLRDWLIEHKIPGIYGIDTRQLTQILREKGIMLAKIIFNNDDLEFYDPNLENLVAQVSTKDIQQYGEGDHTITLVDCGVKNNIIRHFIGRNVKVKRVPWDYDFNVDESDGIFLSNGPGDPKQCEITIQNLKKSFKGDVPIFGICLGSQLMGLASGADTYKLKYGHRSHNQPVREVGTNTCYITSQNHGFAVDEKSLNSEWKPYFKNVNDDTIEGIRHQTKPWFSTQFHPEASGGPTDTEFLFDVFINLVKDYKRTH